MDWKLVATTFGTVFLAELGDKTQLATLTFAAEAQNRWAVLLGSASALVLASIIAVLAGELVSRVISPMWLKRAAGIAFVLIGAWTLYSSMKR